MNGMECELVRYDSGDVVGPALEFGPTKEATADQPVSLRDDKFIGVDGQPFTIKGEISFQEKLIV